MRVIGTAGHVDHGKSALVAALTGTHPDRLKEEQLREMTIELGFAWMTLPDGEEIGIVDVPGHRDFIENMLAGVGGIDAVLFVIAADEGVMPQTREHLAILDILQVQGGIIALTKTDIVPDPDWLELVELDIQEAVQGTILENAPIIRVSARAKTGIEDLRQSLARILADCPPRPDLGRPRLPIDRVFTIAGFGTVITGTLLDGQFTIGEEVEILPRRLRGRIRGMQTHKKKESQALPGSRTAVNISGIDVDQVRRGDVLAWPGRYRTTQRLDVRFKLLKDITLPLRHSTEVKFFTGASEVVARVRLLGVEELLPGQEGWLQLELEEPVVAVRGDHYILRRPSPGETMGGGIIVDPFPQKRHKRFALDLLQRLESLQRGTPEDVFLQASLALGPAGFSEVAARARLSAEEAGNALRELLDSNQMLVLNHAGPAFLPDTVVISRNGWNALTARAQQELQKYHQTFPLRKGILREELKSRLKLTPRLFNLAVRQWAAEKVITEYDNQAALPGHCVVFNAAQQNLVDRLLEQFKKAPFSPPSVKDCLAAVGEEMFNALVEQGNLVRVSEDVAFRSSEYETMLAAVLEHLDREPTLTAAQFRDLFNTSRRYALAFLEYLDAAGLTQREGDVRRLRKKTR